MRKSFENQLSQEWNINNPEMFELNEKRNYKISAVDREWAYYQLHEAVDELKSGILKLFSSLLDKIKMYVI